MSIDAALSSLIDTLRTSRPDLVGTKKRAKVPAGAVHPDLLALWSGLDLQPVVESDLVQPAAAERDDWWLLHRWLAPKEALSQARTLADLPSFPDTLIPIATNDAGDFVCHDRSTGKLFSWSHETRKPKAQRGTLRAAITQLPKIAAREAANKAASPPAASRKITQPETPASKAHTKKQALPKKIVPGKSPILRQILGEHGRGAQFHAVALASDGDLFALVSKSRTVDFGSFERQSRIHLDEAHPLMRAQSVTCDAHGGVLVIYENDLQLWRWRDGRLSLEARAGWTGGREPDGYPRVSLGSEGVRMTSDHLALVATEGWLSSDAKSVVALWERSTFPRAESLAGSPEEHAPAVKIPIARAYGTKLDLSVHGDVLVAESVEPGQTRLSRWDRHGEVAAKTTLAGNYAAFRFLPDGKVAALSQRFDASPLCLLDEALNLERELPAHDGRGMSLEIAPSRSFFVTSSADEIAVWSTTDLTKLTSRKEKKSDEWGSLSVQGVSDTRIFAEPPVLFYDLK